jgi:cyclopropane fatty-acyl-phospholipid synthase-like methyltransferase
MQIFMAIALAFLIVIGLLWIIVPAMYGLPPVSTRRERIRRALELANLQSGETLYDLGSGHGQVLVIAAKEFRARAVGAEIGPVQCAISWVNALWNGVSSKVRVEAGNFYHANLSNADVIFAYLTSSQAERLQEKLKKELKKGARVVTVSFSFPGWEPTYVDRENLLFLYIK